MKIFSFIARLSTKMIISFILIFLISCVLSILLKPRGYSYYMFSPASPNIESDYYRLLLANVFLIFGFIVSIVFVVLLTIKGFLIKKYYYAFSVIIVLLNPFHQPIFFAPIDLFLNEKLLAKANNKKIMGKTTNEIKLILGKPSNENHEIIDNKEYTVWSYRVLPVFWLGSSFKVFFTNDIVTYFKANDR